MGSRYLLSKVIQALVTVLFIVILNFVLFRMMPGSPDRILRNPNLTEEVREAARERWGLNDPLPIQLAKYLGEFLRMDPVQPLVGRVSNFMLLAADERDPSRGEVNPI